MKQQKPYKRVFNANLASHEDWLRARKMGIGGSDAGAILGMNPWRSQIDVYYDKISDNIEERSSEAMRIGTDLEQYVAQRFTEATGKRVMRDAYMMASREHPFMLADIDRRLVGENAILECKTASAYKADEWKDGEIPPSYLVQVMHYMAVAGAEKAYIACVILGRDFVIREVDRDEEVIESLIEQERIFWEEHVQKKSMPAPDGSQAARELLAKIYPEDNGEAVILEPEQEVDLERYDLVKGMIDDLSKEKEQIEQSIKAEMKDAQIGVLAGRKITWKTRKASTTIDKKKLQAEYPEAFEACSKEGKPSRVFKIYSETKEEE